MTTEELARMLRDIDVMEFSEPDICEHETYDELPDYMKEMYIKAAETYQKYFHMEKKHDT